jgi:hypothetical protein
MQKRFGVAEPQVVEDEASSIAPSSPEETALASWRWMLTSLRVPLAYHAIPKSLPLPAQLAKWAGDPWALSLLGPTGCGKSWMAIRLLAAVAEREGYNPNQDFSSPYIFADCPLSVAEIKSQIRTPDEGRTQERLTKAVVLLLDDVGAERGTEYEQDVVSLILRARYNAQRPTILTSNAASLSEIFEPRIASRLAAGVVPVKGRDRRLA